MFHLSQRCPLKMTACNKTVTCVACLEELSKSREKTKTRHDSLQFSRTSRLLWNVYPCSLIHFNIHLPFTERTTDWLSEPRKFSIEQVYSPASSKETRERCITLDCALSNFKPSLLQDNDGDGIPLPKHSMDTLLLSRTVSFSPIVIFTETSWRISCTFVENRIFGLTGSEV